MMFPEMVRGTLDWGLNGDAAFQPLAPAEGVGA